MRSPYLSHTVRQVLTTMASLRIVVVFVLAMLAVVSCMPAPEPSFFGGGKHEHHVIHVPYHVHTVHHYHKIPVYVHKEHHYSHHGGWDWD